MRFLAMTIASLAFANAVFAQTEVVDTDGNGTYSMDELRTTFPDLSEELFAAIDTNGDGAIDADELTAAVEAEVLSAG